MIKRDQIQIRDPFIYVEDSVYYLFGTTDADPWKGNTALFIHQNPMTKGKILRLSLEVTTPMISLHGE